MSTTIAVQGYQTLEGNQNDTNYYQSVIDAQNDEIKKNYERIKEIQRATIETQSYNMQLGQKLSELQDKTTTLHQSIETESAQIKNLTAIVKSSSMSDQKKVGLAILAIVVTAVVVVGVTYSVIHFGNLGK